MDVAKRPKDRYQFVENMIHAISLYPSNNFIYLFKLPAQTIIQSESPTIDGKNRP